MKISRARTRTESTITPRYTARATTRTRTKYTPTTTFMTPATTTARNITEDNEDISKDQSYEKFEKMEIQEKERLKTQIKNMKK